MKAECERAASLCDRIDPLPYSTSPTDLQSHTDQADRICQYGATLVGITEHRQSSGARNQAAHSTGAEGNHPRTA
jgi:hypothetical protein